MKPTYQINEIFYSIQGEGIRVGLPNFFVRFSGCNLKCNQADDGFDCDTEFTSGRKLSAVEIMSACQELNGDCRSVIFTGGEPGLQLDEDLLAWFRNHSFFTAVETNGTVDLVPLWKRKLLSWITLSPKTAEHTIKCLDCDEIKYVRAHSQAVPVPRAHAQNYLISPAFDYDRPEVTNKNIQWCIDLVKSNPKWRLSVQQHKAWRAR